MVKQREAPIVVERTPNLMYFPNAIRNPEFELRKLTLKIFKADTIAEDYKGIQASLEKEFNSAKEAVAKGIKLENIDVSKITDKYEDAKKLKGEFEHSIVLPIPNELQDSSEHNFEQDQGFVGSLASDSGFISGLTERFGAKMAMSTGHRKVSVNPEFFQNYKGSEPRSFTMTFNLIPNSKKEAIQVAEIVRILKQVSSPEMSYSIFMLQPRFFILEFGNPMLQNMMRPLPCVLKSIETNYSAGGYVDTTLDGMPKYISIVLNFTEIRVMEFKDWM